MKTRYQPMLSIAGGPYEAVAEPQDTRAEAELLLQAAMTQWGDVRLDSYIATIDEEEE